MKVAAAVLVAGLAMFQAVPAHAVVTDPEVIRAQLTAVLQSQQAVAMRLGDVSTQNALADQLQKVAAMTPEELLSFQNADLAGLNQALTDSIAALDQAAANATVPPLAPPIAPQFGPGAPSTLRNASYSTLVSGKVCDVRSDTATAAVMKTTAVVASAVNTTLDPVCDQTILGQNIQAACIVSSLIAMAAETAFDLYTNCDGAVDSAEILGIYWRTEDIYNTLVHNHDNLATVDSKIAASNAAVQQIATDLTTHNTAVQAALAAQDVVQAAHNQDLATHRSEMNTLIFDHSLALTNHVVAINARLDAQDAALANLDAALAAHDARLQKAIYAFKLQLQSIQLKLDQIRARLP
jgi:hypothetical protein